MEQHSTETTDPMDKNTPVYGDCMDRMHHMYRVTHHGLSLNFPYKEEVATLRVAYGSSGMNRTAFIMKNLSNHLARDRWSLIRDDIRPSDNSLGLQEGCMETTLLLKSNCAHKNHLIWLSSDFLYDPVFKKI